MTNHAAGLTLRSSVTGARRIAIAGIVLGVIAFWSAIPPFNGRSFAIPFLFGILAIGAGIWAVSRGMRRAGWGAVASGILGLGLGILATRSSVGNLEIVFNASLIASMLVFATPLTFGAIGGMVSERSGVVNVGLEGMMLMGAFWGVYGADKTGSWEGGIVFALVAGGGFGLLHAFWSIHLRADQIVSGIAINFLALGVTGYFFEQLYNGQNIPTGVATVPNVKLPVVSGWSYIGPAIGDLNLLVWVGILLVPVSYVVLFKTAIGLRIRACGEHPRAADTVGIDVYAIRYAAVIASGILVDRLRRRQLHRGHDGGPRLHRARGDDLRQLAAVRRLGRGAALRLLDRDRLPASDLLGLGRRALPGTPVRADADRRRGRDRSFHASGC
jgi:general nucleoside transport system permease protein